MTIAPSSINVHDQLGGLDGAIGSRRRKGHSVALARMFRRHCRNFCGVRPGITTDDWPSVARCAACGCTRGHTTTISLPTRSWSRGSSWCTTPSKVPSYSLRMTRCCGLGVRTGHHHPGEGRLSHSRGCDDC